MANTGIHWGWGLRGTLSYSWGLVIASSLIFGEVMSVFDFVFDNCCSMSANGLVEREEPNLMTNSWKWKRWVCRLIFLCQISVYTWAHLRCRWETLTLGCIIHCLLLGTIFAISFGCLNTNFISCAWHFHAHVPRWVQFSSPHRNLCMYHSMDCCSRVSLAKLSFSLLISRLH